MDDVKLKLICDCCHSKLCQPCSGLSPTELRCMTLSKRLLRFHCQSCQGATSQSDSLVGKIVDNLRPIFDGELRAVRDECSGQFSSLRQQIADLTDTNKELIRLLNPKPVVIPVDQSQKPSNPAVVARQNPGPVVNSGGLGKCSQSNKSIKPAMSRSQTTPSRHGLSSLQSSGEVDSRSTGKLRAPKATNRMNFIRGTLPTPAVSMGSKQDTFAAVARRAQLYIGNINPNANRDSIEQYIRERLPNNDFILDDLPKREEALSRAFKLTIDFSLLETLNKPDFWPQGVIVKRFFRPRVQ